VSGGGDVANVHEGEGVAIVIKIDPYESLTWTWDVSGTSGGTLNVKQGENVVYTAGNKGVDIVVAEAKTADGGIIKQQVTINVEAPATATETPAPTDTPLPSPTGWECTSDRSQKLQSDEIPGQVTIDTPTQGTINLPSGQQVKVGGSYTGVPEGKYLWVFIYSSAAGLHGRYYPQTRDALKGWQPEPTTGQDGRWSLIVNFGAGHLCYEIIVMMADATASQSIADQLKSWAHLNNYAGYELNGPETAVPPDGPGFPEGLVEKVSIEVKTK